MTDTLPTLRIFKPDGSEYVRRIYRNDAGEHTFALGIIVPFPLSAPGQTPALPTQSLWDIAKQALGAQDNLDEAWPKYQGELLAAGHCYPPSGHTQQPVSASVSVGSVTKQLAVFGDRQYTLAGGVSAPAPFTAMPLDLAHAYGGPEAPNNPDGTGAAADSAPPNVEQPAHLILDRKDHPDPATFAPLPITSALRSRYLGKFDAAWLKSRWPHLPDDTDVRFFQAGMADQQRQGFWQGGEAVLVRNMHAEHPDLHGVIPQLRPRFFAHQTKPDGSMGFIELKVCADTVWLLPDYCVGYVIYRAALPIHSSDARDVNALLVRFEAAHALELPVDHYVEECLRLLSPEAFAALPDPAKIQADLARLSTPQLIAKAREQKTALAEMLQSADADGALLREQLLANPRTRQLAQQLGLEAGPDEFFAQIETLLQSLEPANAAQAAVNPRQPTLQSVRPPTLHAAPLAPDAPPQPPAAPALDDANTAAQSRQTITLRQRQGLSCSGLNLMQANLAGLDLAGMDFSGAMLAGANLSGARLQGAQFQHAHLQGAKLDATDLAGCSFQGATLDQASFTGARLAGVQLDGSDCTHANFSGADLTGASLKGATLAYAWLKQIKAAQVDATGADFSHANLDGIDLQRATLDHANLTGARLRRATLDHASCVQANFSLVDASNASCTHCDLSKSQSGPGAQWVGVAFTGALMNAASWMGASLEGVQLQGVKAAQLDLSSTRLQGADLSQADLRGAIFDRADLHEATLVQSNLLGASFVDADLTGCNLSQSNLYGATLADTVLDRTKLLGANVGATILEARDATQSS